MCKNTHTERFVKNFKWLAEPQNSQKMNMIPGMDRAWFADGQEWMSRSGLSVQIVLDVWWCLCVSVLVGYLTGVGKCPFLGILYITSKYLLETTPQ